MKTEELKELGLDEEQIKEVHKLNGQDIEKYKSDVEKYKTEAETIKAEKEQVESQLKTANEKIESFKDINVDEIKAEVENYKTQLKEQQANYEKEMKELKTSQVIELAISNSKAKNMKAVKALLDVDALKESQNLNSDLEAQIESLKESDPYLFDSGKPKVVTPTGNSAGESITEENFREMSYLERLELKQKQPEVYEKLTK